MSCKLKSRSLSTLKLHPYGSCTYLAVIIKLQIREVVSPDGEQWRPMQQRDGMQHLRVHVLGCPFLAILV